MRRSFLNILATKIYTQFAYFLTIITYSAGIIFGYNIFGFYGIGLIAFSILLNCNFYFAYNFSSNLIKLAHHFSYALNLKNLIQRNLWVLNWNLAQNRNKLIAIIFSAYFFSVFSSLGCLVNMFQKKERLEFQSKQFLGILLGISAPNMLFGLSCWISQCISNNIVFLK